MKSRLLAVCIVCFLLSSPATSASIVNVEPDLFSDGTDISTAFSGVVLSAVGGTVGSQIFSYDIVDPCCPNAVPPSTGMNVFGHNGTNNIVWKPSHPNDPAGFRADFLAPVAYVAIDMIQSTPNTQLGSLLAFDVAGNQLDIVVMTGLGQHEVSTARLTRSLPDIAYILVEPGNTDIALDNLRYSISSIPIPPAIWLFGSGMLALLGIARRSPKAT